MLNEIKMSNKANGSLSIDTPSLWERINLSLAKKRLDNPNQATYWSVLSKDRHMSKQLYKWTSIIFIVPILLYFIGLHVIFRDIEPYDSRINYAGFLSILSINIILISFIVVALNEQDDQKQQFIDEEIDENIANWSKSDEAKYGHFFKKVKTSKKKVKVKKSKSKKRSSKSSSKKRSKKNPKNLL